MYDMRCVIILLLLRNGCCPEAFSIPIEARGHGRISPENEHPTLRRSGHRGSQDGGDLPHSAVLGKLFGRDAKLSWHAGDDSSDISFRLVISVPDNVSFVGLGFSPRGDEEEADVVIIAWSKEDMGVLDMFIDRSDILQEDQHHDYILEHFQLHHQNELDSLEVVLTRATNTNDPEDYKIEWGTTRTFIVAGEGVMDSLQGSRLGEMNFVEKPLSLLRSGRHLPDITPADTLSQDFLVENIRIPDDPTTYWCHTVQLNLPDRVHGIKYEPLISAGNEEIVHHMELYHCEVAPDQRLPSYSGPCHHKLSELGVCSKVVAAWATGAGPMVYPAEAGVPIGGPGWSPHLMLEVHYNNPQRLAGLSDNSGIRYTFTKSPRQFDVGVLEVGVTYSPNLVIPPGKQDSTWSGLCLPSCTSKGLPSGGIRVFASQLHAHLSGREIVTRHYRDEQELPPIDRDPHFTMAFQDIRLLPNDVIILPGDTLVTTCHFDSTGRDNVTMGGYGITDEMCVNYLHYYPKADLEVCKSTLSDEALGIFFKETIGPGSSSRSNHKLQGTEDLFSSIRWSETNKYLWNQIISFGSIDEECLSSNGEPFPGNWANLMERRPESGESHLFM